MKSLIFILSEYGYAVIVLGVALETLGLPLPGELLVLFASSTLAPERLSTVGILLAATSGAWMGDQLSYFMGRKGGTRLLDFYCRMTLCSAHCSARAQKFVRRCGTTTLVFARFLVGVRALAVPAIGMAGVSYPRFALFDLVGSLLWGTLVTLAGRVLGEKILPWLAAGHHAAAVVVASLLGVVASVFAYKVWKVRKYGHARLPNEVVLAGQTGPVSVADEFESQNRIHDPRCRDRTET